MHLSHAARALRLNRSFPDVQRFVAHLELATALDPRTDPTTALPTARTWSRVRAEAATAAERLADLEARHDVHTPPDEATRRRMDWLARAAEAPLLPAREVTVQLRHRDAGRASYQVIVDRQDLASALASRYTLIVEDTPGPRIPDGELALRAHEAFADRLELLGTQDASLAFAALQAEGIHVHEVVRGTIGPAMPPGGTLLPLPIHHPALSAVLERASRDLTTVRVDDPLPDSLTLPRPGAGFGLVAARKWSVARSDLPAVRAWFADAGRRALVYAYDPDPFRMQ